jgi:membrane protein YqaA with SNARE-associated domain
MTVAPPLPGVLGSLAPLLDHYGYLAVAGLVTVEDFGVPVPDETIHVAAAVYAGAGRPNIVMVALPGFTAAVIGDNIGFAIGHCGGRPLALRVGRYVCLTPARLDKAQVIRYELYFLIAAAVAIAALIAHYPDTPALSRKSSGRDRPMTGRPRTTPFIRARSGGQPKGVRCLP